MIHRISIVGALILGLLFLTSGARADEPVVTTLADYEDDSVATSITDVRNVLATDCSVTTAAIPARGQRSLIVEIGATKQNASAACDLRFRLATPFTQADRIATYAWITHGSVDVAFRVRDAGGRLFETPPLTLKTRNRWVRLVADLSPRKLELVGPTGSPESTLTWPIRIQGYRVHSHGIGRQTVYLDDLEVEHRVTRAAILRGEFKLNEPTHTYVPGALVRAAVVLENISRRRALPLSVQIAWLRSDGSELTTSSAPINLPASGADYRSRQPVDFSQRIVDPGIYRLVARVRGRRWTTPAVFETTIAVTRTNRALPRGRATFFGLQTNLMREPAADQLLEIEIAREIGVQLLALETPWRIIEPGPGSFKFTVLDNLVNRITQCDIAMMIVLTEPPDWITNRNADHWKRQALVIEALARRYGERVSAYQPLPSEPGRLSDADITALTRIQRRVADVRPNIEICAPPIRVPADSPSTASLPTLPSGARLQLAFETAGDSAAALDALESFAADNKLKWTPGHRWFHRAETLTNSGAMHDAVAMLNHYTRAAREGVGGVVWYDLRDDTNDPRFPERMKGLVQRNFSPKTPLLGFANAVGMLHGLLYVGDVPGTTPEFDSALFIGGQRQVAVLYPKPNRILPAVLTPYQIVDGDLTVLDFDRRMRPLTLSAAPPLANTLRDPFFITLDALRAQSEPMIGLARPWLRLPASVYCGEETTFTIELDAPMNLRRSYLQVRLPENAPLTSSITSRALRAKVGKTLSFDVTLTRTTNKPRASVRAADTAQKSLDPITLTVRLRLEGQTLIVPVTVYPLVGVKQIKTSQKIDAAEFAIGRLDSPDSENATSPSSGWNNDDEFPRASALHTAFQTRKLQLAVALPSSLRIDSTLYLGLAVENADVHTEVSIENLTDRPRLLPAGGTTKKQVRSWRCRLSKDERGRALCIISIPARALGLEKYESGTRLLLATRYVEPQAGGRTMPLVLEWGRGLDGGRSTARYHWIQLLETPAN